MKETDNEEINVTSATDCTGLIPTIPLSDEEEENYRDILKYSPSADKNKKRH